MKNRKELRDLISTIIRDAGFINYYYCGSIYDKYGLLTRSQLISTSDGDMDLYEVFMYYAEKRLLPSFALPEA